MNSLEHITNDSRVVIEADHEFDIVCVTAVADETEAIVIYDSRTEEEIVDEIRHIYNRLGLTKRVK